MQRLQGPENQRTARRAGPAARSEPDQPSTSGVAPARQPRGAVVLVVDDEPPLVDVIRLAIEDLGFRVLTAHDGAEALVLIRDRHPDLVFSDVMMPRLPGDELCRRLKAEPETADIKVVLMTAAGAQSADGVGCDGLLIKPFDLAEVEGLVRRLIPD